jgi:hypothetical protein
MVTTAPDSDAMLTLFPFLKKYSLYLKAPQMGLSPAFYYLCSRNKRYVQQENQDKGAFAPTSRPKGYCGNGMGKDLQK